MKRSLARLKVPSKLLQLSLSLLCSNLVFSQPDFAAFQQQAQQALASTAFSRFEFSAQGWEACLGQPWRIDAGWARWELRDYRRVIDLGNGTSLQTAQRRAGFDADRIGGCGAQPNAQATSQQSAITADSSWENQLPLWLTPPGFLALASKATAEMQAGSGDTTLVSFSVEQGGVRYPFSGRFDEKQQLVHIETLLDDSVFGDMTVTADFGDYQDFGGVQFPSTLVIHQGGFATLNLVITAVTANTAATSELPPRPAGGGGGQAPAVVDAVTRIAPGVFVSNGAYQGVIVEMQAGIVIIDGLQNDMRSQALIEQAKAAIPGKPITHVIGTHAHFDHAAGLRAFAAEGATLITHNSNVEFFAETLRQPRTLRNPVAITVPMQVQGVGESYILEDPVNPIELYRLQGNIHADDMLIAYLPGLKAVVEADVLQPWINPVFGGNNGPHPFLLHLNSELERLGLNYDKFIPVHRPPAPPFMTKADLQQAIAK